MSLYVLGNDVNVRGVRLRAGKTIDTAQYSLADLNAVGAILVPTSATGAVARGATLQQLTRSAQDAQTEVAQKIDQVSPFIATPGSSPGTSSHAYVTNASSPYQIQATDDLVLGDNSSSGAVIAAKMPAAPTPGERHTAKWWKSQSPVAGSMTVDGNGNQIESWSASNGNTSLGATASITLIGGEATWEWMTTIGGNAVNAWVQVS